YGRTACRLPRRSGRRFQFQLRPARGRALTSRPLSARGRPGVRRRPLCIRAQQGLARLRPRFLMTRRLPRRSTCKWPPFSPQRTLELADAGCADWGRRRSADTGRRAGHPRSANDDDAPPHPRAEALAQPVRRVASAAQEGPCGFGPQSQDPASAGLRDSTRNMAASARTGRDRARAALRGGQAGDRRGVRPLRDPDDAAAVARARARRPQCRGAAEDPLLRAAQGGAGPLRAARAAPVRSPLARGSSSSGRGAGSLQGALQGAENSAAVHHGAWLFRRRAPVAVAGRPRLLNGSDDLQVDPPGRQTHSLGHASKTPTRQFDNAHLTPGSSPKIPRNSPADRITSMVGTVRLSPYKCRSRAYLTSRLPSGGSRRRAASAGISAFFCSITSFAGSTSRDSLVGLASSPSRAGF